jgi:hypothetical protein
MGKEHDKRMSEDRRKKPLYWGPVFYRAWCDFSKAPFWRQIGGGVTVAIFTGLLTGFCVQVTWKDFRWAIFSGVLAAVVGAIVVLFMEFLVRAFICTPPKLHNELQETLNSKEAEAAKLRKEKEEKPRLAIELEDEKNGWSGDKNWVCIVVVRNTSQHTTASEVRLSLEEIIGDSIHPPPRPLPYELGKAGTNCAEKKVQLHAEEKVLFELFKFTRQPGIGGWRTFQIQDVPQIDFGTKPMLALQAQGGETREWQFEVRAKGYNLMTVKQRFKLVAEAGSVPRLFKV